MSVKEQVLAMLENNKGCYLSGADLAEQLNVSRNSVWKAVKALQEEGYQIQAVTNKGYCLNTDNDILSVQSITKYLDTQLNNLRLDVRKSVSSTNDLLRTLAQDGAAEGLVLIAEEQKSGKGRLSGRKFHSPAASGIYMSILLRPTIQATEALFITTSAAVAAAKAIETVSGRSTQIKWVNDIFCDGKKVCGILTEAAFNLEGGNLDYAVLGIGINVKRPPQGFASDIENIAGAVLEPGQNVEDIRSKLIAAILHNFWQYYKALDKHTFLPEYKQRSLVVGKQIYVLDGDNKKPARAVAVTDTCELLVEYPDGKREVLSSGEVSIKPILD